jgi:hypothetical protein
MMGICSPSSSPSSTSTADTVIVDYGSPDSIGTSCACVCIQSQSFNTKSTPYHKCSQQSSGECPSCCPTVHVCYTDSNTSPSPCPSPRLSPVSLPIFEVR